MTSTEETTTPTDVVVEEEAKKPSNLSLEVTISKVKHSSKNPPNYSDHRRLRVQVVIIIPSKSGMETVVGFATLPVVQLNTRCPTAKLTRILLEVSAHHPFLILS